MSTKTYQDLIKKKETIAASFLLKRSVRQIISNGLQVYKYSGTIPSHISSYNLKIIKDLIEMNI